MCQKTIFKKWPCLSSNISFYGENLKYQFLGLKVPFLGVPQAPKYTLYTFHPEKPKRKYAESDIILYFLLIFDHYLVFLEPTVKKIVIFDPKTALLGGPEGPPKIILTATPLQKFDNVSKKTIFKKIWPCLSSNTRFYGENLKYAFLSKNGHIWL